MGQTTKLFFDGQTNCFVSMSVTYDLSHNNQLSFIHPNVLLIIFLVFSWESVIFHGKFLIFSTMCKIEWDRWHCFVNFHRKQFPWLCAACVPVVCCLCCCQAHEGDIMSHVYTRTGCQWETTRRTSTCNDNTNQLSPYITIYQHKHSTLDRQCVTAMCGGGQAGHTRGSSH